MNSGRIDQFCYPIIEFVIFAQIIGEQQEELATNNFIAMHICNIFEFGNADSVDTGDFGYF